MDQSVKNNIQFNEIAIDGYERVVEAIEQESGLHALIAIHNTALGPALGGTRIYPYPHKEAALHDVLRLAKGMTYKSAVANTGLGGGKSVIIANPEEHKTDELLQAFARAVHSLDGKYICAEDMGSTTSDMMIIRDITPYVTGLDSEHSSGNPGPFTAYGVFRGLQATSQYLWKTDDLKGKTVAIQGLGHVGSLLAERLFWEGANLILSDIDSHKTARYAKRFGAKRVGPQEIMHVECDIFCPCAIGAILNEQTIPQLRCAAIAGAANNQLHNSDDASLLQERGILYAPDFVINAGGIINVSVEVSETGYDPKQACFLTNQIYDSLLHIFEEARKRKITTDQMACRLAEERLTSKQNARIAPCCFR